MVVVYRFVPVYVTPLMVIRSVQQVFKGESPAWHHEWVPFDRISPHLPMAVIASEDNRFATHNGFDFIEIQKAMKGIFLSILLFLSTLSIQGAESNKEYTLWYNRPAYNRGGNFSQIAARGFPYDEDWEKWSLPIGNGAMGVCIFGRTDVERIQLAEKTMGNKGAYGMGGFTNFAEIYLDIHHNYAQDYKLSLIHI